MWSNDTSNYKVKDYVMTPKDLPDHVMKMDEWLKIKLLGLSADEQVEQLKDIIYAMEKEAFRVHTENIERINKHDETITQIYKKLELLGL